MKFLPEQIAAAAKFVGMSAAAIALSMTALPASASPIVFEGQNAALFPGANPAANALLMASVNKPTNNGQPSSSASSLSSTNANSIIEQSTL